MYISPETQRLLHDAVRSHEALIERFRAGEAERRGFRAVYEALESALADVDEEHLVAPIAGGWSPAEVLVHIAEHDQKIEEVTRRGLGHVIEHGLEHARDLWRARAATPAG